MSIPSLFVKKPVMTSMVFLGVLLFGVLSWFRLPQELFPNISVPQLVIITKYPNAAPEEIEHLITKPIEEAAGTIPNLKRIVSMSKEGVSAVTLQFGWGADMGLAHLSTREKLDRIKDRIPEEAEEPIIKRVNPFAKPILIMSVTGNQTLSEMTELCEDVIKKKLEKVDGVASVTISGGQKREIVIEVDRGRLDASHISLPMVVDALKNSNYDYPAGVTQGQQWEYLVRTQGRFKTMDDIGQTIVHVENPEIDPVFKWKQRETREHSSASREQRLIPLSHLAEIKLGFEDKTSYSRYNGKENISITIQKQSEANTVKVSENVEAALKDLRPSLPKSLQITMTYDESDFITDALSNMESNVFMGGILAFVILLYFLGNFRDAINMGTAIPVASLATLIMMDIGGFSLNILTMAGLALAVGTLTDTATVITENIVRHNRILKKPMLDSAVDGAQEMVPSMVSATATNIVVFLPLLFISGMAQQLFAGLFYVTVFTNVAGLMVSLSLIPRLAAYNWDLPKFLQFKKMSKFVLTEEKASSVDNFYKKYLLYYLNNPKSLLAILIFLSALAAVILIWTPKVFMPKVDQGQFIIDLTMPVGTRLDITNNVASRLERVLASIGNLDVMVNVGSTQDEEDLDALDSHQARVVVTIPPKSRLRTHRVIERFKKLEKNEDLEDGVLTFTLQDSPLKSALAGSAAVEIEIKGPELDNIRSYSQELTKKLQALPFLYSIKSSLSLPSLETQVHVDKDRAASFELSVADIAKTALIAIKGTVATTFKEGGKETNIRVRLREVDRHDSNGIRQLVLRSPRGQVVPLEAVAQVTAGRGASEIMHLDQQRAVRITAEISGKSTDQALDEVDKILKEYHHMKDYSIQMAGESRQRTESFSTLKYVFILAILVIYMVMAAEFESLIQPLIIMSTVPFSFIGVAYTLFLTNTPLSSVVILGLVILAGIVVNNGIVLIDHLNSLRREGMPLRQAVVEGSVNRLRPILLTSVTTILGVLPLAIGFGRGNELSQPLAVVTFGGIFVSTLLTILAIPILYERLARPLKKED